MRPRHGQGVLRGGVQQGPSKIDESGGSTSRDYPKRGGTVLGGGQRELDEREVHIYFAKGIMLECTVSFKQRERQSLPQQNNQREAQPGHRKEEADYDGDHPSVLTTVSLGPLCVFSMDMTYVPGMYVFLLW